MTDAQGNLGLAPTGRDLCPWSGRCSAPLLLAQVLSNWIGTEVVFHSSVILRSCGESSGNLGDVHQFMPKVTESWHQPEGQDMFVKRKQL